MELGSPSVESLDERQRSLSSLRQIIQEPSLQASYGRPSPSTTPSPTGTANAEDFRGDRDIETNKSKSLEQKPAIDVHGSDFI